MIPHRERPAFDTFVMSSSDRLLRTAYLLCGDRGHAEDLVQTALMRTARQWRRARDFPEAYARRTVVNLAKDRWRQRAHRPAEAPLDRDVAGPETDPLGDRDVLLRAARRLAPGQRTVLVLRYFDDLSVEEPQPPSAARRAPSSRKPRAPWGTSGPLSSPRRRTSVLTDDDLALELGAAFRAATADLTYTGRARPPRRAAVALPAALAAAVAVAAVTAGVIGTAGPSRPASRPTAAEPTAAGPTPAGSRPAHPPAAKPTLVTETFRWRDSRSPTGATPAGPIRSWPNWPWAGCPLVSGQFT